MKKIGIYGGSFNPPHKGHVNLLKLVCKKMELDEVWIVASFNHRFKNNSPESASHRLDIFKMINIAFPKKIGKTQIILETDKEKWGGSTYKMMKEFSIKRQNDKFYIIMGSDCASVIKSYLNWKKLVKEFEFIIVYRHDDWTTYNDYNEIFEGIFDKYEYLFSKDTFSSSGFKKALKSIPTDVLKYIYENKLYLSN